MEKKPSKFSKRKLKMEPENSEKNKEK